MARIRTIKPEFWTSAQIAECSPNVRLLFIGMWNFCDDYGVTPACETRMKMQVFPADAISKTDIRRMIDELLANELIQEYEVAGTRYWWVTGWDKHQKPDCKTGLYPRPDGSVGTKIRRMNTEHSPNEHRTFAGHSCKEKEKEKEKKEDKPSPPTESPLDFIWTVGTQILGDKARSIIGKARKSVGDERVTQVLAQMASMKPPVSDPLPYFIKATTPKERGLVL